MRLFRRLAGLAVAAVAVLALAGCVAGGPPTDGAAGSTVGTPRAGERTPPPMIIDPAKFDYTAQVVTSRGVFTIRLFDDLAPQTVNNFVTLARRNFFANQTFHRITLNIAQTGDPGGTGTGGPGYSVADEPNTVPNTRGTVAMARTRGATTFGSQWYINLKDNPDLDAGGPGERFYPFGEIVSGIEVLEALAAVGTEDGRPSDTISVARITITEKPVTP